MYYDFKNRKSKSNNENVVWYSKFGQRYTYTKDSQVDNAQYKKKPIRLLKNVNLHFNVW